MNLEIHYLNFDVFFYLFSDSHEPTNESYDNENIRESSRLYPNDLDSTRDQPSNNEATRNKPNNGESTRDLAEDNETLGVSTSHANEESGDPRMRRRKRSVNDSTRQGHLTEHQGHLSMHQGHSSEYQGHSRRKRSLSQEFIIELLLVADLKMAEYHGSGLDAYVLTLMATVS